MVFSSITFLTVFLPITVILYYLPLLFKKANNSKIYGKYRNAILCLASLLFYAWGEPRNIVLMLLSIVFNYTAALHICKKQEVGKNKKSVFVVAVIFNLILLGFFKYSGFFVDNILFFTGKGSSFNPPLLPIGISFYTFQILSYVIDVYKGKVSVQKSLLDFALYISMFPQLIAGPIVQYSDIDSQLAQREVNFPRVSEGIVVFVKGLAKKTVLANTAGAVYENFLAAGFDDLSVIGAWSAIIFYAFQIYFDFGGYSDMAKGLGGIFGFTFPDNFRYPYMSDSITDFWRRWHITLSTWFRDYVYIPLGGNRCSPVRRIFNLFAVWALTGLWHGASWNFVLWGIYYFVLLVLEKYVLGGFISKIPVILRKIVSFILVLFGWVLFSFTDLSDVLSFFKVMFAAEAYFSARDIYILTSNIAILIVMAVLSTDILSIKEENRNKPVFIFVRYMLTVVFFILSMICLIGESYNPFLYFRF